MAYILSKLLPWPCAPGIQPDSLVVGLVFRWRWRWSPPPCCSGFLRMVSQGLWRWLEAPWERRRFGGPQADAVWCSVVAAIPPPARRG